MKKRSLVTSFLYSSLLLFLFVPRLLFAQPVKLDSNTDQLLPYQNEIGVAYLKTHLSVLADDSLKGRDTGSEGLEIAARYLRKQYEALGVQPAGDNNSYFQTFALSAPKRDSTVFELYKGDQLIDRSIESGDTTGSFIRSFGGTGSLSGDIVFAGFGVNDPTSGVNHLGDMNLQDKWVLVFQQIPHVVAGDTIVKPFLNQKYRFNTLLQKGTEGILVIPQMSTPEFRASAKKLQVAYSEPTRLGLEYLEDVPVGLAKGYTMVKPSMAAQLLGVEPTPEELHKYRQSLIQNITGFTPQPTGFSLDQTPHTSRVEVQTKNVLAMLEGADPELSDEVVVLTSHYDHVGVGRTDSTGDAIYNGADDDGSGTVALLNIAKALTEARADGYVPKRSILFLHVTAEEIGLLGSRYYSDHPVIPMEKTVANINIDMIGRVDAQHKEEEVTNYSYIIGSELISSELDSLLNVANAQSGNIELDKSYNDLQDPNRFYRRSDHWNFGRFRVPFIFFFSGVHEDYHRPSDEIHKIRFEKMAKIIKTIYATTVVVANEETPPKVDNEEFIDITKSDTR